MKRIDELINRDLFRVNPLACMSAAQVVRGYQPRLESMPWGNLPLPVQLTFKLAFVAACHQINWDFLQSRLAEVLLTREPDNLPEYVASVNALDVHSWLQGYHKPERIRAGERARLIRDVGQKLLSFHEGNPVRLLEAAEYKLTGPTGFIAQLDLFEAYQQDPLRKKSHVLVQDLSREGIAQFKDENKIAPAIDYHIMRLYLRTGRVTPIFHEVADVLKGRPRPRPRLVKLLRQAVGEALELTAFYAGLTVAATNYVEWQIGRSICTKEAPNCIAQRESIDIDPDIAALYCTSCPYVDFCIAYKDQEWRSLREPDFAKSFY